MLNRRVTERDMDRARVRAQHLPRNLKHMGERAVRGGMDVVRLKRLVGHTPRASLPRQVRTCSEEGEAHGSGGENG